jgi:predicted DNA-binding transcriptional regulator AlpA
MLAALLRAVTESDTRIGSKEVAERVYAKPATIRSWVAERAPKGNPFPKPNLYLGRQAWDPAVIDAWMEREASNRPRALQKRIANW